MSDIMQFRGEYTFLSNFTELETPLVVKRGADKFVCRTSEHFYQCMKFKCNLRLQVAEHPSKGLKKFIEKHKESVRYDWHDIKEDVMMYILKYKFSESNPILRQQLLDTGYKELTEGNWWGDDFWGICLKTEMGDNRLGVMLMEIREGIRNGLL